MENKVSLSSLSDSTGGQLKSRNVCFASSSVKDPSIEVAKNLTQPDTVDVNIGFLKICRRYAINFVLPNSIGETESLNCISPSVGVVVKNLHFRDNAIVVDLEYNCEHKEGVVTENFTLQSETNSSKRLVVILHMEILRKDQGTPSLKNGVRCIETRLDYDSEQSDWQGF